MNNKKMWYALLCGLGFNAGLAAAGNSSSGGGEYVTYEHNPWFLGPDPVSYCVQVDDEQFSLSQPAALAVIKDALADWQITIRHLAMRPVAADLLGAQGLGFATDFRYTECHDGVDLTFYLGTKTKDIRTSLTQLAKHTIGFAKQSSFDPSKGRAKGYIWLVADRGSEAYAGPKKTDYDFWRLPHVAFNVLLHELGHVFGFAHQDGVMHEAMPADELKEPLYTSYSSSLYLAQRWTKLAGTAMGKVCGPIKGTAEALAPFFAAKGMSSFPNVCIERTGDVAKPGLMLSFVGQSLLKPIEVPIRQTGVDTQSFLSPVVGNYRATADARMLKSHEFLSCEVDVLHGYFERNGKTFAVDVETSQRTVRVRYFDPVRLTSAYFDLALPGRALGYQDF